MIESQHVVDELPAFTLGCLEDEEVIRVIAHVNECEACREELQVYQSVTNQLGLAAPLAQIPPGLKQKVISSIPMKSKQSRKPELPGLSGLLRGLAAAWVVASLALVLILAMNNADMRREVAELQQAATQEARFQTIALTGSGPTPDASGLIVISADGKHGTLVVDDLPSLDEDHEYQLWLIKDGDRTSGGTFKVDDDGYGALWVWAPLPLADYPAFGVTIEPAGGSPSPTGEKVLGGDL